MRVRFYIEPDGKITIGEVIKSPDEKLSREMIRVIRSSKGKWTPRKVRGVPQRTAYEYGVNFLGMAECAPGTPGGTNPAGGSEGRPLAGAPRR